MDKEHIQNKEIHKMPESSVEKVSPYRAKAQLEQKVLDEAVQEALELLKQLRSGTKKRR